MHAQIERTFDPSTAEVYVLGGSSGIPSSSFVEPPRQGMQAPVVLAASPTPSTYGNSPPTISRQVDNRSQSHLESFPGPAIQSGHITYNPYATTPHSSVTRTPNSTTNGADAGFQSTPHQPFSTPQSYASAHAITDARQSPTGSHGAERPHSTKVSSDDRTPAGQRTDKPKKNVRPCGTCQSSKHKCDMEPPYSELLCRNCEEHRRKCTPHVPYSVAKDRLSRPSEEPRPVNGYPGFDPISPIPTLERRQTSYQYDSSSISDLHANSSNSASLSTRQGLSPSSYDPNTSHSANITRGGIGHHEATQTRSSRPAASQPGPTSPFSSQTFRS